MNYYDNDSFLFLCHWLNTLRCNGKNSLLTYMFYIYAKPLLNHSALSNKNISHLLHTRLEYSNLNF